MTMRTAVLAGLVLVGVVLWLAIEPPRRLSGPELARRGPRVLRTSAAGVRRVEAALGGRGFVAERTRDGWRLDGTPATPAAADALDALATHLAGLRAVDAFRTTGFGAFGLDPPAGLVTVTTRHDTARLALGTINAAGSAVYARRDERPRVFQLGSYLVTALERVIANRTPGASSASAAGDRIVGLAGAARAATERPQLGQEEERLVSVRPADEDALPAQHVDERGLVARRLGSG
jgi:uncharacterized protein DUF4340